MFKDCYWDKDANKIHIWDDVTGYSSFPLERYAYQVDPKGDYVTMTGLKVKKVKSWSTEAVDKGMVFEHDVRPETRILVDRYFESDEPSKGNIVFIFDIETAKEGKYSKPVDATNKITSIAYWDNESSEYVCLLLDQEQRIQDGIFEGSTLKRFDFEEDMLLYFLKEYTRIKPNIVSGWNSEFYDIPYLYRRLENLFGEEVAKQLSPIGIVEEKKHSKFYSVKIAGVAHLDYLALYKNFTYNEEPRYTLDAISKKELGRGKVEYEGSLDDLFKNDPMKFVRYNISDVELVVAMDKKLDFIEIARGICHKGHVPYEDIFMSSRYLDGASLVYCKKNNLVALSGNQTQREGRAQGAFVKTPSPGLYQYIYDCDASSLYPSIIRTLNISPETLFGKVLNWNEDDWVSNKGLVFKVHLFAGDISDQLFGEDENIIEIDKSNFQEFLTSKNLSIASNGCLYRLDNPGLIPSILTDWFNERKSYRKIAGEKKNSGDIEGYQYYDRKQLITKILLNSFYGVLLLPSFRFYNRNNGEAVTITGQSVSKHAMNVSNFYYNKKLGTESHDYVVIVDTDSVFLPALPLVRLSYDGNDDLILVEKTLQVATEVQTVINKSFDKYAERFHNIKTHYWEFKQELIARRAFFGDAKKRYAMWIINKNGLEFDELDVKGLDMVRSSFPQTFRTFQKKLIEEILHDVPVKELNQKIKEYKEFFKTEPLSNIMLPTSVKELSKFKYGQKGTPVHVKSAQNYNKLLELFKVESSPKFEDGDKILWAYLKTNPYGFETIALRGYEDPQPIVEFVERFIHKEEIFDRSFLSKIETIWNALGWGKVDISDENEFF